jgi:hypothetical protein
MNPGTRSNQVKKYNFQVFPAFLSVPGNRWWCNRINPATGTGIIVQRDATAAGAGAFFAVAKRVKKKYSDDFCPGLVLPGPFLTTLNARSVNTYSYFPPLHLRRGDSGKPEREEACE